MKPVADLSGTSLRTGLIDQFIVATYGGAGSKTLVRGVLNQPPPGASPVNLVRGHHTHQRVPFPSVPAGKKVIYVVQASTNDDFTEEPVPPGPAGRCIPPHWMRPAPASGFIVWLTGMPCAGKTTLARGLQQQIGALVPTEVLDGDEVRRLFSPELGFSRQDRALNVERIAQLARLLAKHGVAAIVACVSPYADMRSRAREIAREAHLAFLEVHVVAPTHILMARDTKELYARASAGRLPGVTGPPDPYQVPAAPDLTIDTGAESVESSVGRLLALLRSRSLLTSP